LDLLHMFVLPTSLAYGDVGGISIPAPAFAISAPGETSGPTSGLRRSPEGVATL